MDAKTIKRQMDELRRLQKRVQELEQQIKLLTAFPEGLNAQLNVMITDLAAKDAEGFKTATSLAMEWIRTLGGKPKLYGLVAAAVVIRFTIDLMEGKIGPEQ